MAKWVDVENVIDEIASSLKIESHSEKGKGFDAGLEYVMGLIENAPTLTQTNEFLFPCDFCAYNPPSSFDGKPCAFCPAEQM